MLRDPHGVIIEYFAVVWVGSEAPHLRVGYDDPSHQTFWEYATLFLALMVWGDRFVASKLLILGDNIGALSDALSLKGRGALEAISRELSWRQARRGWQFDVGHLPSEYNNIADSLSRVADPHGYAWPSLALSSASPKRPPRLADLWLAAPR